MAYDTIIIGSGSMGMAAGYYLSKAGQRVLLIDSFDPPHNNGSHHGETRIIRHAYGEGENYVPLALRAQELWSELEKESNMKLFLKTGVINIGDKESSFVKEVQESAKKHNLPLETLTASEMNKEWPGIKFPDHFIGCLETTSGVLFSEKCIEAYRMLSESFGATLLPNTQVTDIELGEGNVKICTENDTFEANSLIVSAGAWAKKILHSININVPLTTLRKTFSWFNAEDDAYHSNSFPAFTINLKDGMYYGFPNINGAGIKIGRHDGGQEVDMDNSLKPYGTYTEDEGDVAKVLQNYFPKSETLKQGKTCVYTNTPDGDFIIDRLPDHPNVAIACGFSGHGFKFSSVVGEILSKMIRNETIEFDLSPFSLERFQ